MQEKARPRDPDRGVLSYGKTVRDHVRGLWRGQLSYYEFLDGMVGAVQMNFERAWYDGAAECGISPSELTDEERDRLQTEINTEMTYLINYANDINAHNRENKGKLSPYMLRAEMWANSYERIRNLGKGMACADQKLKWHTSVHCKEHCEDCSYANNRVYRGSTWMSYGWEPRNHALACHGFRCCCDWFPTSDPVTPGFPRRLL